MSVSINGSGQTVVQIITSTFTSTASTTSTTAVDSGIQATITPTNSSNKILIMATLNVSIVVVNRIHFKIYGGNATSYIGDTAQTGHRSAASWVPRGGDSYIMNSVPLLYLDAPATTSPTTYKIQWWVEANTGYINRPASTDGNGAGQASSIVLMELAYA
jgi:hypothetical protein